MFLRDFLKNFDGETSIRVEDWQDIYYAGKLCNCPYWLMDFMIEENHQIIINITGVVIIKVYKTEDYVPMEVELKLKSLLPLIADDRTILKVIDGKKFTVLYEGEVRKCPYGIAELTFGKNSSTSFSVENNVFIVTLNDKEI